MEGDLHKRNWPVLILAALTLAGYLVLILGLAPQLSAQSQAMTPFGLRVIGDDLAVTTDYLAALTAAGRAI